MRRRLHYHPRRGVGRQQQHYKHLHQSRPRHPGSEYWPGKKSCSRAKGCATLNFRSIISTLSSFPLLNWALKDCLGPPSGFSPSSPVTSPVSSTQTGPKSIGFPPSRVVTNGDRTTLNARMGRKYLPMVIFLSGFRIESSFGLKCMKVVEESGVRLPEFFCSLDSDPEGPLDDRSQRRPCLQK